MRIVILGGGTVGTSIADLLCRNGHIVTVVDSDPDHVRRLNDELDVRAITGSASDSSILFQAEVIGSDLCLAVTGVDEVNLVAASMAKAMGARRSIARVFAPGFRDTSTFDYQRHFRIDRLLSLEHLAAMEFARDIRNPGYLAVEHFARGELEVQEIQIQSPSKVVGIPIKELGMPKAVRIGSIARGSSTRIAGAEDRLEAGDRITMIGRRTDIDEVKPRFQSKHESNRRVVIAGGGQTGYQLARTLDGLRFSVLLMEQSEERCAFLASNLKNATVVQADATRRLVLEEERVGAADVFVACMGDDENNIMVGVEARDVGAKRIMAIVSRPDYAKVVGKLGIHLAVSPRDVMAKQVLGYLNVGPVVARIPLADSGIRVMEVEVLDDVPATKHVLADVQLPSQCLVVAVIRGEFVSVPGADDRLKPGDTVVLLADQSAEQAALQFFG
jgi:trk system potassium uptake protein TrkA